MALKVSSLCLAHEWLPYLSAAWDAQPAQTLKTESGEEIAEEMNKVQKSHKEEGLRKKNSLTDKRTATAISALAEQSPSQV